MITSSTGRPETARSDQGFGMIEVVVAMFLLALLAVAVLPTIISALRLSSTNITLSTATQLLNQQMDEARELADTCAAIQTFANDPVGLLITDPRGTVLRVHRQAATCPAVYPSTIRFTSWVTIDGDTDRIAESETLVFVAEAG